MDLKLHKLPVTPGSTKKAKRKGQGLGSGTGKTAGRGHKGQNARSGGGKGPGFEGGQMKLTMRLPKRGFHNLFSVKYSTVNVSDLEDRFEDGANVTYGDIVKRGLVRSAKFPLKVLGNGDINKALTVKANAFSKSAAKKIESAGGKIEVI